MIFLDDDSIDMLCIIAIILSSKNVLVINTTASSHIVRCSSTTRNTIRTDDHRFVVP
jgi:hypothetical protein